MGKLSTKISKNLNTVVEEINNSNPEELLNSGVKAKNKRTKINNEENSLFESLNVSNDSPKTYEEVCENDLNLAKEKQLPEPDFDYRNFYEKGDIIYYVQYHSTLNEKTIHKLYIRTIYPRMIVGTAEKGYCHCINYNERNNLFKSLIDANNFSNSIELEKVNITDEITINHLKDSEEE